MSSSSKVASRLCGQGLGADLPGGTLPSPAPVPGQSRLPPSSNRHPPSCNPPSSGGGRELGLRREVAWLGPGARQRGSGVPAPQGCLGDTST